jgi:hypothetical protein
MRNRLRHGLLTAALTTLLLAPASLAWAQSAPDGAPDQPADDNTMTTPAASANPQLSDLPGVLLLASTRTSAQPGDTVDKYRLYTLHQGQLTALNVPDEKLGSTSAVLSQDTRRLLLNAGGQVLYVVDLSGATPPRQILDRLPPVAFGQTDMYLSVAWSRDESQALVVRPFPKGISLLSVVKGASTALPMVGQTPSFSPDGSQVALSYSDSDKATPSTFTVSVDPLSAFNKLTPATAFETAPQWLADGSIAYIAAADRWEVRLGNSGQTDVRTLAQAPAGFVISDLAVSPDGRWFAYTLQAIQENHRVVHIASISDPTVGLDLPQDRTWNDRVLGWVPGA